MPATRFWVAAVLAALLAYGLISLPGIAREWGISADGIIVLLVWTAVATLAVPLSRANPSLRVVGLAIAGIMLLRMGMALSAAHRDSPGDPHSYLILAKALLDGRGLVIYEPYLGGQYRALFPPLYPLLLAGWGRIFGFSTEAQLSLNTLTDALAALVMTRIATRLGQPHAGRAAAFLYLIWPSALFSAGLAQKESLSILLVLAIAWTWLRLAERGARDRAAVVQLGMAAGLLALSQPGWAPIALLFGLVLIRRAGLVRIVTSGLPAGMIAALVMTPWWLRNWTLFHAFVPLTTASGVSLWIGNNPDATGNWQPTPAELRGLGELAYGPRAAAIARAWITTHPDSFVYLTLQKFLRACGVAEFGLVRLRAMTPSPATWITAALLPLSYLLHLVMLAGGAAAALVNRAPVLILLVAACGLQIALFGIWFEFGERHREFVTPFLLLLLMTTVAPRDA
jgi:hypothetical protein